MEPQRNKSLIIQFFKKLIFNLLSFIPLSLLTTFIVGYMMNEYFIKLYNSTLIKSAYQVLPTMTFTALFTFFFGILILLVVFVFALSTSIMPRSLLTLSLKLGWNIIRILCVIQFLAQCVLFFALSYFIIKLLNLYIPFLFGTIGFFLAIFIFYAIKNIFSQNKIDARVEGKLLSQSDAPSLWQRVNTLAASLNTQPPAQIIAGIDASFYATEVPVELVNGEKYQGRTLYVSLSLLRQLSLEEADALLLRELAHLHHGNIKQPKNLAVTWRNYDFFLRRISSSILPRFACQPLSLYFFLFSWVIRGDGQKNELMADKIAAERTSAKALINALIKMNAFACFQSNLVYKTDKANDINNVDNLSEMVNSGLLQYTDSTDFLTDMAKQATTHPVDHYPELSVRMANVSYSLEPNMYRAVVRQAPTSNWLAFIPSANEITKELWDQYENELKGELEHKIIYTSNPTNEAEERVILKHFPPVKFPLKDGKEVSLTYKGISMPDGTEILWEDLEGDGYDFDKKASVCTIWFMADGKSIGKELIFPPNFDLNSFESTYYDYWERSLNVQEYIKEQAEEQN